MAQVDVSFEVIVADQSDDFSILCARPELSDARVRVLHMDRGGKSRALNSAARVAKGRYLAVTDDDVIVEPDWLSAALHAFERHKPCDAIQGKISPLGEKPGEDYVAPLQTKWAQGQPLSGITVWEGYGGNQIFTREAWVAVDGMDPRIGPGCRCCASEDAEILYRMFMRGLKIWYDPSVRVWHDGWETADARRRKQRAYNRAEMAAHIKCWFELRGPVMKDMVAKCRRPLAQGIMHLTHRRRGSAKYEFLKLLWYLSGIPLGVRLALESKRNSYATLVEDNKAVVSVAKEGKDCPCP